MVDEPAARHGRVLAPSCILCDECAEYILDLDTVPDAAPTIPLIHIYKGFSSFYKIVYTALMAAMDAETIRGWVATAETELADLVRQSEDLQRRVAQARVQLGLMYELLASVTDEPAPGHPEVMGADRSVRERVVEAAVQILREHRKPMRIQDIHAEFLRRRFALPGSGTPANIAAHLVDRNLFARPRRGVFGLAEWGSEAPPVEAEQPLADGHRNRKRSRNE